MCSQSNCHELYAAISFGIRGWWGLAVAVLTSVDQSKRLLWVADLLLQAGQVCLQRLDYCIGFGGGFFQHGVQIIHPCVKEICNTEL